MCKYILEQGGEQKQSIFSMFAKEEAEKEPTEAEIEKGSDPSAGSLKNRAPKILISVMGWFQEKGIRKGDPQIIKENYINCQKLECKKASSLHQGGSGLLGKRMRRPLSIFF